MKRIVVLQLLYTNARWIDCAVTKFCNFAIERNYKACFDPSPLPSFVNNLIKVSQRFASLFSISSFAHNSVCVETFFDVTTELQIF
mmetsp:Transcript_19137/g.28875  ORF Transcript_19137/g.28875 Transcript_19137/m.28875 type:complete len:86 (+) Transcript_19137:887-1144(+)